MLTGLDRTPSLTATLSLSAAPLMDHRVSPEMLAYASLLALSQADLELVVTREIEQNPALERLESECCAVCGQSVPCTCRSRSRRSQPAETAPLDAFVAADVSAQEALLAELRPLVAASEHRILSYLVGCLDDRGRLDVTVDEVAAALAVAVRRVEAALALVRRHGPPGIAARDLRECLLLQLEHLHSQGCDDELAARVVERCLEPLAAGRLGTVAAELGVPHTDVVRAVQFIRTRLRPYVTFGGSRVAPPAVPDVVIAAVPGSPIAFNVELVEPRRLKLVVSPDYERLAIGHGHVGADRDGLIAQVEAARSFIDRVQRRWQTLRAVAEVVVDRQREYLARGPRYLTRLTRADVAASVGVHESTVSRATAGRYAALPSGRIVPLARFFECSGGPCAALAELIAGESEPRSDAALARELSRHGFKVSRRTVAKYRQRLGIAAHRDR